MAGDPLTMETAWSGEAFADGLPGAAEEWFASADARRVVRAYTHHYLTRYRRDRARGLDDKRLAHPRGNARGRFYEHMVLSALSHALIRSAPEDVEFICAGGRTPLRDTAFQRNDGFDVIVRAPSFPLGKPIVRAEYDALVWDPRGSLTLIASTSSAQALGSLISDIGRQQMIAMRLADSATPPPVLLISPHDLSHLCPQIEGLTTVEVPFPEAHWDAVIDPARTPSGRRIPPREHLGPLLQGTRLPAFPSLLDSLADAFLGAVEAGLDMRTFCEAHRSDLLMHRRVYLGELTRPHSADAVARLIRDHREDLVTDPVAAIRAGQARVHVTLRCENRRRRVTPVIHVVKGSRKAPAECRIMPRRKPKWIRGWHKLDALRCDLPPPPRRSITADAVFAAIDACVPTV